MASWRWIAAGAASAVAVGVVVVPRWPKSDPPPATVSDPAGDVVGVGPEALRPALDLVQVSLDRHGDAFLARLRLASPLDRAALGDGRVDYVLTLQGQGGDYVVRALVSGKRAEASVTAASAPDRPFVLRPPAIRGAQVEVTVPVKALPHLPGTFGWGVTANGGGSQDRAPANFSALYPARRRSR